MKRQLLILLLPMIAVVAMAQRTITGTVIEDETGDAIPQTTVKLLRADSTLVKGVLTDIEGRFSVTFDACPVTVAPFSMTASTCIVMLPRAMSLSAMVRLLV